MVAVIFIIAAAQAFKIFREERITMRLNRQVLLAAGLIMVQLCASLSVPAVSFAQSAAAPATIAASAPKPHATMGYPSWRDFPENTDAIAVQGNYLWLGYITTTTILDMNYNYANLTKWDTTTNKAVATYTTPGSVGTSMAIDKSGNVWFASGGVTKFDGTNFQSFNEFTTGFPSGNVSAITVDDNDNVWIGTDQGSIAEYNDSSWKNYSNINNSQYSGAIRGLATDKNGNVWATFTDNNYCDNNKPVISGALDKFDGSKWTVYAIPAQNSTNYSAWYGPTTDPSGNVWLGIYTFTDCNNPNNITTRLAKFDGTNWQFYDDAGKFSGSIVSDAQGNIWGDSNGVLAEFNGSSWQTFQEPYRNQDSTSYGYKPWHNRAIVIDANGNKWLGNYKLTKFNQTDPMLTQIKYGFDFNALPGNSSIPDQTFTLSAYNANITYAATISYTSFYSPAVPNISNSNDWLNLTPASNTVNAGSSQNLTLSVSPANLTAGTYTAEITISDQNDPTDNLTVLVTLRVGYVYYLPNLDTGNVTLSNVVVQNTSKTNTANITFEHYSETRFNLFNTISLAPLAQSVINDDLTIYEGILVSSQPLNIIVTNPHYQGLGKSSVAVSQGGSQLIAPLILNNAFGGYNTNLVIFNTTSDVVTATVQYYDQSGKLVPTATSTFNLLRYQSSLSPYQSTIGTLPDGFIGWAKITSSPGSNLVAQVVEENANGFSAAFNAQVASSSTLYASTIFNNAFGGYDTGASIVNPNPNPVNITIDYYDNNGNALPPASFTLQPYALTSIYQGGTQGKSGITGIPNGGLPDGFYGSATITSQGGGVAMLVNEIGPANNNVLASGSYTARPAASGTLTLPIICNGGYGYTTGLTVLNTSGAAVNATIQYFNTDGTPLKNANGAPLTARFSMAAHGSYPIYQGAANLPNNFYGLAVVTTTSGPTNALIATTNAISSDNFYTYTEPEM